MDQVTQEQYHSLGRGKMSTRQELYCHGCSQYVQFDLDLSLDGCHTLHCPVCGHVHYRVIVGGIITGTRRPPGIQWDINSNSITTSSISTWSSYDTGGTSSTINERSLLYSRWLDTGTSC